MQSANRRHKKTTYRQNAYVEGSTARQLYALPKEHTRPKVEKQKQQRPRKAHARREKTLPMNGASVLVLTVAAVATLVICVQYVQLQSEITYRLKQINAMEVELADLTEHNNELHKRINSYVDLNYIYKVATEELGMKYASKGQISKYQNSGSEYVRQYEDIPDYKK